MPGPRFLKKLTALLVTAVFFFTGAGFPVQDFATAATIPGTAKTNQQEAVKG